MGTWTREVPTLSGSLVDVREVVASDAPTLHELLSDPAVTEHLSPPPPSVSAFAGFVAWAQRERERGNGICFGVVPRGLDAAVGIIQVRALEPTFFTAEWGFALGVAFWSTGVFVDAAKLVAEFAFTDMKVNRLEARAVRLNARGQGALQKLGARPEGTLSRAFRKHGRLENQLLWTLTQDDWRQPALVPARLSAEQAAAHVADAVQEMRRTMDTAPRAIVPPAEPYPFFLTDSEKE